MQHEAGPGSGAADRVLEEGVSQTWPGLRSGKTLGTAFSRLEICRAPEKTLDAGRTAAPGIPLCRRHLCEAHCEEARSLRGCRRRKADGDRHAASAASGTDVLVRKGRRRRRIAE